MNENYEGFFFYKNLSSKNILSKAQLFIDSFVIWFEKIFQFQCIFCCCCLTLIDSVDSFLFINLFVQSAHTEYVYWTYYLFRFPIHLIYYFAQFNEWIRNIFSLTVFLLEKWFQLLLLLLVLKMSFSFNLLIVWCV